MLQKLIQQLFITFIFFSNVFSQQYLNDWENSISGPDYLEATSVCADAQGNIYTLGSFSGTADMNPGNGVFNLTSSGLRDIFIQKTDPNGNFLWAFKIGGIGNDYGKQIKIGNGAIFVIGQFEETVDFTNGSTMFEFTASSNGGDAFVLAMGANGAVSWVRQLGGAGSEIAMDLVIEANNNVSVVGHFQSQFDLDPSSGEDFVLTNGSNDIFIMKLDVSGNLVWSTTIGGTGSEAANSLTLDDTGNIIIGGAFSGQLDFDPGPNIENYVSTGQQDGFLLKLDENGAYIWTKQYESSGATSPFCIIREVVFKSNHLYVGAEYRSSVDVDPGSSVQTLTSEVIGYDIFLQKLSINGDHIWVKDFKNNMDNPMVKDIIIDNDQNLYFLTKGDMNFTTATDTISTGYEMGIWIFDSNADLFWNFSTGNYSSDASQSFAIDNSNNLIFVGWFTGILRCDVYEPIQSLPFLQSDNSSGTSPSDAFIIKITPCTPTYSNFNVERCDSYTWPVNNATYTSSGTYEELLLNSAGCDSLVTLNLTINNTVYHTQEVTACESFTWIDGLTYNNGANTPMYTFTSGTSSGCDSIVYLDLTILQNAEAYEAITSCDSYTWSQTNETYAVTGNYYDTIPGAALNGCDSIYRLSLTIRNSNEINQDIFLCVGTDITIGSNTYSQPGSYTDVLINQYGCDSIVNTNIYIDSLQLNVLEINHVSCGNDGRIFFDVISNYGYSTNDFNTFNESTGLLSEGSYTYSISDGNGCSDDTVITIVNRNSNYVKVTNLGFQDETDVIGTPEQGMYNLPAILLKNSSNPRNVIELGTPVRFKIFVSNNRENGLSINSGEAILTCSAPSSGIPYWANLSDYITISNNSVGINNIPWGGSGWSSDAFEIIIDSAILSLGIWDIQFELKLQESGDVWETTCIHFPLTGLWLDTSLVDDDNLADSQGNSNSLCESLEVIEFTPRVSNGQLNEFVVVKTPYGTFEDLNNYPGIIIWDGIVGVNGPVEDGSWWNYFMNQPNTIVPGDFNTVPQYDFVFDYNYTGIYEFILHTIVGGGVELFNNSNTQTLLKWGLPYTFNEGYPTAPNCDNFNVNLTIQNETIEDAEDGSASVTVQGGVLPYSYEWSDGSTGVFNNGLAPGNYSIIVMDNEVCSDTIDFIIQPAECNNLSASVDVTVNSSSGANDGTATVVVTGGNSPFTYYWSSGASSSATTTTDLAGGEYNVTVVDDIGCEVSVDFNVGTVGIQELIAQEKHFEIKLYPNPTNNEVMLDLGKEVEQLKVELIDLNGKVLFQENYQNQQIIKTSLVNQATGMYYIHVKFNGVDEMIKVIKQ